MPSHTASSALISLYFAKEGTPWQYEVWKDITGIHHGLFPEDDALLPAGCTREQSNNLSSYFSRYNNISGEEAKIKFAGGRTGGDVVPGRDFWRKFVNSHWRKWRIHARITEAFTEGEVHPFTICSSFSGHNKSVSLVVHVSDDIYSSIYCHS